MWHFTCAAALNTPPFSFRVVSTFHEHRYNVHVVFGGTCKLRNGKKRKETKRNGKKKNEKKTRRKVTKRNEKKNETQKKTKTK